MENTAKPIAPTTPAFNPAAETKMYQLEYYTDRKLNTIVLDNLDSPHYFDWDRPCDKIHLDLSRAFREQ